MIKLTHAERHPTDAGHYALADHCTPFVTNNKRHEKNGLLEADPHSFDLITDQPLSDDPKPSTSSDEKRPLPKKPQDTCRSRARCAPVVHRSFSNEFC